MERVVYVLGAGFSAPAGIPTIRDFLTKAKDLYFANLEEKRFQYFAGVLGDIGALHASKTYIDLDLLNIEEILSALQMTDVLTNRNRGDHLARFVGDVIDFYTPKPRKEVLEQHWPWQLFGAEPYSMYGRFVGSLLDLHARNENEKDEDAPPAIVWTQVPTPSVSYSVITLNYDSLISSCCDSLTANAGAAEGAPKIPRLDVAYLHGSVKRGDIVPPTWTKGPPERVKEDWQRAFEQLSGANHIRILGYSLPPSDLYLKYLFCTAIAQSQHLKTIDVICLDPSGDVARRFKSLFVFRELRFVSADLTAYMQRCEIGGAQLGGVRWVHWNTLERRHEEFMLEHAEHVEPER